MTIRAHQNKTEQSRGAGRGRCGPERACTWPAPPPRRNKRGTRTEALSQRHSTVTGEPHARAKRTHARTRWTARAINEKPR